MTTVLHAAAGYAFLLLVIRAAPRRPGGQLTLGDFVLVFLIGGVIILSTVGDDHSLTNCTCAVITIGLLHRLTSWAKTRWRRLGALIDGVPLVLVRRGRVERDVLHRMRISDSDLKAAARLKGLRSLEDVDYAILERNGGISVLVDADPTTSDEL